ncbi:hypothetical protein JTB14_009017 [Gonioctena quinquepunctata]|nr:hypothetical protein JTB14_009017 [Gonioctena quinquepunctata]
MKYLPKNCKYTPWITDNIKLMQKPQLDKNSRLPQHWTYYKELRNLTNIAIKAEKKAYLNFKLNNTDIKGEWNELKKLNVTKSGNKELPKQKMERFSIE